MVDNVPLELEDIFGSILNKLSTLIKAVNWYQILSDAIWLQNIYWYKEFNAEEAYTKRFEFHKQGEFRSLFILLENERKCHIAKMDVQPFLF